MKNNYNHYKIIIKQLLNGNRVVFQYKKEKIVFVLAEKVKELSLQEMLQECGQIKIITTDFFCEKKNIKSTKIPWNTKRNLKIIIDDLLEGNLSDQNLNENLLLITLDEKQLPRLNNWQANLLEFIANISHISMIIVGIIITKTNCQIFMTQDEFLSFRAFNKTLLSQAGITEVNLLQGQFELYSFYSQIDQHYHWAFVKKNRQKDNNTPLIRIESECLTGHVLGSLLCDCSAQLKQGLQEINTYGYGALIYLRQEGRGIGLDAKLQAYYMQQIHKMDTVDANLAIGVPEEARDYIIGAQILYHLNFSICKLLTNNPSKIKGLKNYGIEIKKQISHIIPASKHNRKYLETKRDRMGHLIDERLN